MNTSEILRALRSHSITKDKFVGVFPSNRLPDNIQKPCCLVANTDEDSGPGAHWVAFYFDENGVADYFDSYGMPPVVDSFKIYLKSNATRWNMNSVQLQGFMSSVCGQYCIYFLLHRCQGVPMNKIIRLFGNKFVNDAFVTEFVNKFFDLKTETFEDEVVANQLCNAFDLNKL